MIPRKYILSLLLFASIVLCTLACDDKEKDPSPSPSYDLEFSDKL